MFVHKLLTNKNPNKKFCEWFQKPKLEVFGNILAKEFKALICLLYSVVLTSLILLSSCENKLFKENKPKDRILDYVICWGFMQL